LTICRLCRKEVKKVLQHHYPVTEELGGTQTIPVCHPCHRRDHILFDRLRNEVEKGYLQLTIDGFDPYAERKAQIKAALDRISSQKKLPLDFEK
jgi:hypothetical protein